jgi:tRNA dimethylallyltransferase
LRTVGYQEWWPCFSGEYTQEHAIELIKQNSRRYAKRQVTWFGRGEQYTAVSGLEEALKSLGVN